MRTFTVGRMGDQPFTITANGVSAKHAQITITDDNRWHIQDLGSTNHTYVRDAEGNFYMIDNMDIREDTVIRLGTGGHHSYTFMAHRLIAAPDDYSYEFKRVKKLRQRLTEEEKHIGDTINTHSWITKFSGLALLLIIALLDMIIHLPQNPYIRYLAIALAPAITGVLFKDDKKTLNEAREKRQKLLVCPHCGRPLTSYEIDQMQCSACKAK